MKKRIKIDINGLVQGVGFRPFIYKIAVRNRLNGYVLNNTEGVEIEVEGEDKDVDYFLNSVEKECPPLADITDIKITEKSLNLFKDFRINKSSTAAKRKTLISPDVSICDDCLSELFDPKNRRYKYPFISCTNCGPRFTIIFDIPYDRLNTTMNAFQMCSECKTEYENPLDRRFHAQTNACFKCGPVVFLTDAIGNTIENEKPIEKTIELLKEGKIVAVKGLGGFHLICDAKNDETILKLRNRKHREEKPFAILADNLTAVSEFAYVSREEEKVLLSHQRPIVLLRKKKENHISEHVAPNNRYFGVLLPYTPLHYLIIRNNFSTLVDTSGNLSNEPIAIDNKDAIKKLSGIADYFLLHNRDIYVRSDDSVYMSIDKKLYPIRRSRGYVPSPVHLNKKLENILACGGELKNSFCLVKGKYAFISQHIGDLEDLQTYEFYQSSIEHLKKIIEMKPEIIAYDLHPGYLSTKYAQDIENVKKIGIQHHHAHIASCMAENGITEKVIGLALDGTGYGTDGNIWGGEVLLADLIEFERLAHFDYLPMPGGEKAIKEPWRMGLSYLYKVFGEEIWDTGIGFINNIDKNVSKLLVRMINENVNSPLTSSLGRLFDGVSSITGVRNTANYEGQAAVELESIIEENTESGVYQYTIINENEKYIIMYDEIIKSIINDILNNVNKGIISYKFHKTLVKIFVEICEKVRMVKDINIAALSGGCFQNLFLLKNIKNGLIAKGFDVIHHTKVPTNDGGISLGQAVIAGNRFILKEKQNSEARSRNAEGNYTKRD